MIRRIDTPTAGERERREEVRSTSRTTKAAHEARPERADVQAFISHLAFVLVSRLPRLTDRCVQEILRNESAYQGRLVARDDLWRSVHDNILRHLEAITDLATDPIDGARERVDAARATGKRRAEQGFPLEALLHAFRIGGRVIWEGFVEEARGRDLASSEYLLDGATIVWDVVDVQSAAVADAYRQTEFEIARRSDVRAQALFDALVGDPLEAGRVAPDAALALDLPEKGRYLVVVAEVRSDGRGMLEGPVDAFLTKGISSAWRLRPRREIGLVAIGDIPVESVVRILEPLATGRVGVSLPVDGLAEAAGAYGLAETALATVPPGEHEIALLENRLEAGLVVRAPEIAARLGHRVLGPLRELSDSERTILLETLSAYLSSGASAAKTAAVLFCHRNTIFNRIRRLESLTGRSLSDPKDVVAFSLALEAERLLPDA